MANEFYTVIVVPHAKARFRKIQVPLRLARWVMAGAAVFALALTGVLVHYTRVAAEVYELRRLRAENQVLTEKTREYEQNAGKLQAKVERLHGIVSKLGIMAGLDHALPDTHIGGEGGVASIETVPPAIADGHSLADMDLSVSALTDKSTRLEVFYRDQKMLLSSTPSIWPVRGYLSATFGRRLDPFTGRPDFHPGIDISTPIGTRVVAPADGIVLSCAPSGGYGNAIIVDHGYGVVSRYGHLDSYNVRPGQRIHRGDVIGFVGSTGRSTGPHLHYEVWVREQAQNPIHFILDEYRSFG
jgi:murein DD-endopeptidase MepM/ murein hydrolase activator NlpD